MTAPGPPLVVLTRDEPGNRRWATVLRRRSLTPFSFPCLRTAPVAMTPELAHNLQDLPAYSWLVFTSPAGVRHFMSLVASLDTSRNLDRMPPVAAIGSQTSAEALAAGLSITFTPTHPTALSLAAEIPLAAGQKILLVQSSLAAPDPMLELKDRGALVTNLRLYQTLLIENPDPAFEQLLLSGHIGHLVFASPSAVKGYLNRLSAPAQTASLVLPTVSIGATTAACLNEAGFTGILIAQAPTPEAIANLILLGQ